MLKNKDMKKIISKWISKVIIFLCVISFFVGAGSADSVMGDGRLWLLLIMLFAPFLVGYFMNEVGWLDWIDDEI